jgi:deoxyguanosine kinase
MKKVFLSLGTNLGKKREYLSAATQEIARKIGNCTLISGIYETEAWGFESENNFLNQVIEITTNLEPSVLISQCLEIEKELGRERNNSGKYESRIIDIDILFYGDEVIHSENLQIPHPHLHKRRFILKPLNEIAPDMIHPALGKSISKLLTECTDTGICIKCTDI